MAFRLNRVSALSTLNLWICFAYLQILTIGEFEGPKLSSLSSWSLVSQLFKYKFNTMRNFSWEWNHHLYQVRWYRWACWDNSYSLWHPWPIQSKVKPTLKSSSHSSQPVLLGTKMQILLLLLMLNHCMLFPSFYLVLLLKYFLVKTLQFFMLIIRKLFSICRSYLRTSLTSS